MKNTKLKLFYDGECPLCHREVKHYVKIDKRDVLIPVNIKDPEFKAEDYGLNEKEINDRMHAIDDEGNVFIGIDTFTEIWDRLPRWNLLSPMVTNRLVRPLADWGYDIFAFHIRPRLPKRDCSAEGCHL
jgi:predicted DCC family thiol-disulfide oxidoreductase YuxK